MLVISQGPHLRGAKPCTARFTEIHVLSTWALQTAAEVVGRKIAEKCKEMGVEKVVFDRGGFLYHGRVAVRSAAVSQRAFCNTIVVACSDAVCPRDRYRRLPTLLARVALCSELGIGVR